MISKNPNKDHPLLALPREDLDLIAELALHSGSLKGLARAYSVSYPTIRARLDKVIQRLRDALEDKAPDPLTDLLATLVQRGELSLTSAHAIRDLARSNSVDTSASTNSEGATS